MAWLGIRDEGLGISLLGSWAAMDKLRRLQMECPHLEVKGHPAQHLPNCYQWILSDVKTSRARQT